MVHVRQVTSVLGVVLLFTVVSIKQLLVLNCTTEIVLYRAAAKLDFGVIGIKLMVLEWWLAEEEVVVIEQIIVLEQKKQTTESLVQNIWMTLKKDAKHFVPWKYMRLTYGFVDFSFEEFSSCD